MNDSYREGVGFKKTVWKGMEGEYGRRRSYFDLIWGLKYYGIFAVIFLWKMHLNFEFFYSFFQSFIFHLAIFGMY